MTAQVKSVCVYSLRLGQRAEGPTEAPPYKGQVSSVEAGAREISLGSGRRAGGPRGLLEIGGVIVRAQRRNERWERWRRQEEKTCEMNGEAHGREKQTGERGRERGDREREQERRGEGE